MSLLLPVVLAVAAAAEPAPEAKGRGLVAQMREALGGAKKLDAVHGFSLEADMRRVIPAEGGGDARDMSGEMTVDAQTPDKYLRIETLSPFPGAPAFSLGTGLDGADVWRAPLGGGGPNMVIRTPGPDTPAAFEAMRRRVKAEAARLALVLFGTSGDGFTFAYAGDAESPEGKADVIDVAGPDELRAKLFLDKKTHRPLFLSFMAQIPRMQVMRGTPGASMEHAPAGANAAPPTEAEARLFVSDFKPVDGILLPHHVSQSMQIGPSEEWTIRKWKLNPALKPDLFKKRS